MTVDPEARIKFFQAFDDVNHPDFMLPLVQGLQDQNAAVRLRATDALIDYRANATIMQWLKVLAESDPDPRVRQEAARAFREENRRDGDTRR
jgi:HEAT repeat protein